MGKVAGLLSCWASDNRNIKEGQEVREHIYLYDILNLSSPDVPFTFWHIYKN